MMNDCITEAGTSITTSHITHVCMSGGLSAVPKVAQLVKALAPDAVFPKVRLEPSEAQCVGAALHARDLLALGLLDNAPVASPVLPSLTKAVLLSGAPQGALVCVVPKGSVLPCSATLTATVKTSQAYLRVAFADDDAGTGAVSVGELVSTIPEGSSSVKIDIVMSVEGSIDVSVSVEGAQDPLSKLNIPAGK
jgi:hypothetical protein